jgi:hypothetical protein
LSFRKLLHARFERGQELRNRLRRAQSLRSCWQYNCERRSWNFSSSLFEARG